MTAIAISPTAIDAFVHIEAIKVVGRHRKDLGDLTDLAASIKDVDLLNPITLTRDSQLVAGQRRLEACRLLGWAEVPVRFVDSLDDAARLLRAERDENTCRKDMLLSEKAALGEALHEIAAQDAKGRQGTRTDLGRELPSTHGVKSVVGETAEVVADALGIGKSNYYELRMVYRAANDPDLTDDERQLAQESLAEMDSRGAVQTVARKFRSQLRAKREAQESKKAVIAQSEDPNWTPELKDRSVAAKQRREQILREMAVAGYTSQQISAKLGRRADAIREMARELGITITADEALGVRTRKSIDSNRVVRETAIALEGLAMGVQLVNINDLDPAEIDGWASSITTSIRTLNRLVRHLKEKAL